MSANQLWLAMGVPADAVISSGPGAGVTIDPPQSRLLTAIVEAGVNGEFDVTDPTRAARDKLLSLTDWTQAADSPLTQEQRAAWAAYRQALRDLPQTDGEWPTPPQ